jgi:hypothetical protein
MLLKATMALVVACAGLMPQGSDTGAVREWGEQSGPFQLSISTNKQQYAAEELIKLTAVVKNVSDGPARFARPSPVTFYEMDIRVPMPEWIPFRPQAVLTPDGQAQKHPWRSNFAGMTICAGVETTDQFDLNKLYYMSAPGEYRITFSCKLPQKLGDRDFAITSNELRITILPDKE